MKTKQIAGVTFEVVNPRTKKADDIRWRGTRVKGDTVAHVYRTPSQAKIEIEEYWRQVAFEIGGMTYFHIASANCNQFTIGFYAHIDDKEYLFYITKAHNYMVEM